MGSTSDLFGGPDDGRAAAPRFPDGFRYAPSPNVAYAMFAGGGIASGVCDIELCFGGDFFIDLIGFPEGSNITAVASTDAPEPASLVLLGTGLGLGAALIQRRKRSR